QAEISRERERQATALGLLARSLVEVDTLADLSLIRDTLQHVVNGEAFILVTQQDDAMAESRLTTVDLSQGALNAHEQAVADWVHKDGETGGLGTDTLPSVSTLFVPLTASSTIAGVLGVRPRPPTLRFSPDQLQLIDAAAGQLALAVQRIKSADAARQSQL